MQITESFQKLNFWWRDPNIVLLIRRRTNSVVVSFPWHNRSSWQILCACYSTPSCELSLLIWPVSRADNMEWEADIDVPVATAVSWSPMVSTWVYVVTRLWCDVDTRSCEVIIVAGLLEDRTLRWDSSGLTSCRFMYGDPSEFWTVNMVIGHSNSSRVDSVGVGGPAMDTQIFILMDTVLCTQIKLIGSS